MDIIIIGGGVVGLTMANLLSTIENLHITLLEPNQPSLDWDHNFYDVRCSAIAYSARNILHSIGVWDRVCQQRLGFYNKMSVWHTANDAAIDFSAQQLKLSELGYIVENRVLQSCLYTELLSKKNVQIIFSSASKLEQHADFNRLYLPDRYLDAKLIIGADGAKSWVRETANIPSYQADYNQSSIVATIKTEMPHDNIARQRFATDGPLAFLPLDDPHYCSIVWTSDPLNIKQLMDLEPVAFCTKLEQSFNHKLGSLQLHGIRASIPLRRLHAKNYLASRIALIGDSAHVIHPLAGQGLNLGILDAAALFETVSTAHAKKQDIGTHSVLRKYERWRKSHNLSMLAIVEGFKRYADKLSYLNLGLLNNFSFAKNMIIRYAMGVSGDVPYSAI